MLRAGAGGDRAVLPRLPTPLHLLRPARLLGQAGATATRSKLVDEVERLHREPRREVHHARRREPDDAPARLGALLTELASRRLPVRFFATIRATDIVRDADILPLYRAAGILYVLMGIESTERRRAPRDPQGLDHARRLRGLPAAQEHGIFSILGHIVGLGDETWSTFRAARRQLRPSTTAITSTRCTSPRTTGRPSGRRPGPQVVEPDPRSWDYRHQVLAEESLRPWQLLLAVKWLELRFHLRSRRVWSILRERDRFRRRQLLWCSLHTGLVWLAEIAEFATRAAVRAATWPCPRRLGEVKRRTGKPHGRRLPLAVLDGMVRRRKRRGRHSRPHGGDARVGPAVPANAASRRQLAGKRVPGRT